MDVILHEELIALLMNANVVYQLHIYLLVLHIHEIFRSCVAVAAFLIVKRRMQYDTAVESVQAGRGGVDVIPNQSLQRLLREMESPAFNPWPDPEQELGTSQPNKRKRVMTTSPSSNWKITEVSGDGNCYYRVIALHVYGNEREYMQVRHDLCGQVDHVYKLDYIPNLYLTPDTFSKIPRWAGAGEPMLSEDWVPSVRKSNFKEYILTNRAYAHDSVHALADAAYPAFQITVWETLPQRQEYKLSRSPIAGGEARARIDVLCQRSEKHYVSMVLKNS